MFSTLNLPPMFAPDVAEPVTVIVSTNSCLHLKDVEPISKLPSVFGSKTLLILPTNSISSAVASPSLTPPFKLV